MGATHILINEEELVRQTQAGNTAAFGTIYDHYIRPIYTFVYYKTHHKETAEDITSAVFFKALSAIKSVDPKKPFSPWLYRIAQNTVIDHYRTKKVSADIEDVWDVISDNVDITEGTDTDLTFAHVKKYMHVLTGRERDVLVLRIWEEKSYKEIGDILGVSEGNSKVILSRGLEKLRKVMPPLLFTTLITKFFI
ncbi:MAG: sigma-70 family RNA polymerase sigma factor [Candidatus Paceibacterota bacterium]|jgi:RNA polymerase sigma-70 factor (ECF subfamily)